MTFWQSTTEDNTTTKKKNRICDAFFFNTILLFAVLSGGIIWSQEKYIINHRNLFVKIDEDIPVKFSGLIEIIKPDPKLTCSRANYTNIFRVQKNQFSQLIKEIEKYITEKKLTFAVKCSFKYILNILKKNLSYVNEIYDTKINWSSCALSDEQANKNFEKLWEKLFYTYNEKPKPKKSYEKEEAKISDKPTDEENSLCIKNTPELFCDILNYFMFRFSVKKCKDGNVFCKLKKTELVVDFEKLYSTWQDSLSHICIEPEKIDYSQETEEEMEYNKIIEPPPTELEKSK
jgi:hypothetical protein